MLGVYQVAFSVFMVLVVIVSSGIPLAVSKLTASYRVTKENGVEVERTLISTDTYSPIAQIKKVALTEVGF